MTVEEIFSEIANHMIEGLMIHSQLADYYGFLGMDGYQACHNYHFFDESVNYRKILNYYEHHYDKLVIEKRAKDPDVIPESWFNYKRMDVDTETKKNAVKAGFEKWITWEQDTKTLYEVLFKELMDINEVAAAMELKKYICDVTEELAFAKQKMIEISAGGYDISDIMNWQENRKKKYDKKLKEMEIKLC